MRSKVFRQMRRVVPNERARMKEYTDTLREQNKNMFNTLLAAIIHAGGTLKIPQNLFDLIEAGDKFNVAYEGGEMTLTFIKDPGNQGRDETVVSDEVKGEICVD